MSKKWDICGLALIWLTIRGDAVEFASALNVRLGLSDVAHDVWWLIVESFLSFYEILLLTWMRSNATIDLTRRCGHHYA